MDAPYVIPVTIPEGEGPILKHLRTWMGLVDNFVKGNGLYAFVVEVGGVAQDMLYLGCHPNIEAAVAEARKLYPEYAGKVVGPLRLLPSQDPTATPLEAQNYSYEFLHEIPASAA